jgi:acyl-CoA thioesterase FadM
MGIILLVIARFRCRFQHGVMAFSVSFPTRHTDAFAGTGFVHAGVLLALTEMAYAAFEPHCGVSKPEHVVSMQRETRATYHAPLRWQEGATIHVLTTEAEARGFTQEFRVHSTATGARVATFTHRWAWIDTRSGRRLEIPAEAQAQYLAG